MSMHNHMASAHTYRCTFPLQYYLKVIFFPGNSKCVSCEWLSCLHPVPLNLAENYTMVKKGS